MLPNGPHDPDPQDVFKPSRQEERWSSLLVTLAFYLVIILLGVAAELPAGKHWLLAFRSEVSGTVLDARSLSAHFSGPHFSGPHFSEPHASGGRARI